jgi:NAD(P)-dependent dehydrogenase (short-subunit alcohol dehydrogenase family)
MVFVASVSGLSAAPNHGAYGAAKAGLMALAKTAAIEHAPQRIRVNTVSPGNVLTPRALTLMDADTMARRRANIPLGRLVEPAEIAATIVYLLSDLAAMVTGQNLIVDGGVDAKFEYRD